MSGPGPRRLASRLYPGLLGLAASLAIEPVIGAPYLSIARWLHEFTAWPEPRRAAWRRAHLDSVVRHAVAHVPYYQARFGGRAASGGVGLSALPVIDKDTIRADEDAFRAEGWERIPHIWKRTGGTSGDPWRYPLDRLAWAQMYGAQLHAWSLAGYRYGDRVAVLGTPPSLGFGRHTWKTRLRQRLERRVVSTAGLEVDPATSLRRAVAAGEARATLWYGYAGTVAAMADAVLHAGVEVPAPRAIVTTAETLQPSWRQVIEAAFAAPVVDQYGCNDGGVLASGCPEGRFHLAENLSIVEVLEGDQPCPPGVEGDIVVTNLHARAVPFLRYRVGDRGVLGEGTCPCGRPGGTLAALCGRSWDRILRADGTALSSMAFWWIFRDTPQVRRWQVVQPDPTGLTVRLRVAPGYGPDEAALIERGFRRMCGQGMAIRVTTSEPIEVTSGGKHKSVVRGPVRTARPRP